MLKHTSNVCVTVSNYRCLECVSSCVAAVFLSCENVCLSVFLYPQHPRVRSMFTTLPSHLINNVNKNMPNQISFLALYAACSNHYFSLQFNRNIRCMLQNCLRSFPIGLVSSVVKCCDCKETHSLTQSIWCVSISF